MRKNVDIKEYAEHILQKMASGGVFLTSKYNGKVNTMTIGWGGICYYWKDMIFQAPVRYSRFSHELIEKSGVFTVSVPLDGDDVSAQLIYCGKNSGSNVDKFAECSITAENSVSVDVPIIKECSLHLECEVVFKTDVDKATLDEKIDKRWYPDYHTLFFGRVLECYITSEE